MSIETRQLLPYIVSRYEPGTVPDHIAQQITTLSNLSFQQGASAEEILAGEDQYLTWPEAARHFLVLGPDDHLIAATHIVERFVDFHEHPVHLGGIGGVCVDVQHRQQGIARQLVAQAMADLAMKGCDVAFLCTDPETQKTAPLYGKAGFVPLGRSYTYDGLKTSRRYTQHDGWIAPVCSIEIFHQILGEIEPFYIGKGNW